MTKSSNANVHTEQSNHHNNVDSYPIAQDNPYHLQFSDSPGMKLVSYPFDESCFSNWKRSMTIALYARNKLGFVDYSISKPVSTTAMFKSWSHCNGIVISWILGALSKSIGRSIISSMSAYEMWSELEEKYSVFNGAQLFGLHKDSLKFLRQIVVLLITLPS